MCLVSVCIPTYNAQTTIKKTIESVLCSTHAELEIIVNDDASTDNTPAIVNAIEDPRISYFQNNENVGVPANWNLSIKKATGEFVSLLNHDDLMGPFWVSFAVHTFRKRPHIGWVASAHQIVDSEGRMLKITRHFKQTRELSQEECFLYNARLRGLGPGFIARRIILEQLGYPFYDVIAGPQADNDLFLRLSINSPMYYSAHPHNAWRLHQQNLTHWWTVIDQAKQGLYTLNKVFNDPELPQHLHSYKNNCLNHYLQRIAYQKEITIQQGNIQTAEHLSKILIENGFPID